jgi:hypothetical protein
LRRVPRDALAMTVTLYARRALGIAAPWRGAALGGPAVRVVPPFSRRLVGLLITPSRPQGVRAVSGPDVKKSGQGRLPVDAEEAGGHPRPTLPLVGLLPTLQFDSCPKRSGGAATTGQRRRLVRAGRHRRRAASRRPCRHPTPATLDASVSPPCSTHSERMLKRKPTRIELKPEDREEYFAHKKETAKPPSEVESAKPSEKEVRIGLAKAR